MLKEGLYGFDADNGAVRVFKGEALVQSGDQSVKVKGSRELDLNAGGKLKPRKFDKDSYQQSDLYRFSNLRSAIPGGSECRRGPQLLCRRTWMVWTGLVLGPVLHLVHLDSR